MDKTAIKNFAIWARNKLIESVSDRAGLMGVTAKGIADPLPQRTGDAEFYDYGAAEPYMIAGDTIRQRQELVDAIRRKENETDYATAYRYIMEEVAYTWFNRLIAIRFMEVNDYLPSHLRVLSSESGKVEPDLVEAPFDSDLDFTEREKEDILLLKRANKLDDLFRLLFIKQCNALNALLPGLFERTNDYTEVLLNLSLIDQDGVIHHLVHDIPEDDFNVERGGQVEIIGWLYQYYNTELNEVVYDGSLSKSKVPKELLPAATTIYTPHWAVAYMVQNSLGRLWLEGHPEAKALFIPTEAERRAYAEGARDPEDRKWYYYLEQAEQEPEVEVKLAEIRAEHAKLRPEDIKIIDPCMGSGHILVYAFDVLMQIYESVGYGQREAAQSILTNNLYGLDIDERAYQMAYFAVMMKAREYDRRIFSRGIEPHLFAIPESEELSDKYLSYFDEAKTTASYLIEAFKNAKEFGSLLKSDIAETELKNLKSQIDHLENVLETLDLYDKAFVVEALQSIKPLVEAAGYFLTKFDVVVTNLPYFGSSRFSPILDNYVKKYYKDVKSDLSMAMYQKALRDFVKQNGFIAFITTTSWMFLSSFEKLRQSIYDGYSIYSIVDFGTELFDGKVGHNPIVSWVTRKLKVDYTMTAVRLVDYCYSRRNEKQPQFFNEGNRYIRKQSDFSKIPGSPVSAYKGSVQQLKAFDKYKMLTEYGEPRQGLITGAVDRFVRKWYECIITDINFCSSPEKSFHERKWFPYCNGGSFRKWYGNNEDVVNWENNGLEIKNFRDKKGKQCSRPQNQQYYFREGGSWGAVTNAPLSIRYFQNGFIFSNAGMALFTENTILRYLIAFLNSKLSLMFLKLFNEGLNYNQSDIAKIPVALANIDEVLVFADNLIELSKSDWDSFETSWDFQQDPLVRYSRELWDATGIGATMNFYYKGEKQPFHSPMELAYLLWKGECNHRFKELQQNEEELNRIFINIYGLQDELTPEVADKDVTVYCIYDTKEEIPESLKGSNYVLTKRDVVVNFISYAVGCMFGRYSLNREGLVFAGGDFDNIYWKHKGEAPLTESGEIEPGGNYAGISLAKNHYPRFKDAETWEEATVLSYEPDADNIIPICDENYFEDDITGRFIKFVEVVFGKEDLTANLQFIADALGSKGSARDIIRNYFLKDFFTDHCKRYQNRPIYWLFDSGKQNGFKALVYLHRYNPDTIGMLRVDYLHRMQKIYESEIERMQENINANYEVAKSEKRKEKMLKQLKETRDYDEKISHLALARTVLDLDDGVKVNYRKLQTAADGQFYEVLANSKKIIGKDKKKK